MFSDPIKLRLAATIDLSGRTQCLKPADPALLGRLCPIVEDVDMDSGMFSLNTSAVYYIAGLVQHENGVTGKNNRDSVIENLEKAKLQGREVRNFFSYVCQKEDHSGTDFKKASFLLKEVAAGRIDDRILRTAVEERQVNKDAVEAREHLDSAYAHHEKKQSISNLSSSLLPKQEPMFMKEEFAKKQPDSYSIPSNQRNSL